MLKISAKGYSVFEGMNSGFIKFFCQTTRKGSAKNKKKKNRQNKSYLPEESNTFPSHQTLCNGKV